MMLLRQIPTSSMSISSISLSSLARSLPSNSSILLSLLTSLVLLSFVRVVFVYLTRRIGTSPQKQAQVQVEEKAADLPDGSRQHRSLWRWRQFTWDSIPSLPVSLAVPGNDSHRKGIGMQEKRSSQPWQTVRGRRGPTFETPLPAIYQSKEPLSMAKIIMSRHTYRRPSSRPPARQINPPTRTLLSSPSSSSSPSSPSPSPSPPSPAPSIV